MSGPASSGGGMHFVPHATECWGPAVGQFPNFKLVDPLDDGSDGISANSTYVLDNGTWDNLKKTYKDFEGFPASKAGPEAMAAVLQPVLDPLEGKPNIADLQHVSEGSVLHGLKKRYRGGEIYTNVGRIVVALNPFETRTDLYNNMQLTRYRQSPKPYELAPHIFQTAAATYRGVADDAQNQSALITGESGAGKTESTKLLLRFLATSFAGGQSGSRVMSTVGATPQQASIEERLVCANPILEAFGNASTSRNPNSSRFGKWIEVKLSPNMRIHSASVTSYMLELPRVCEHLSTDRNYHIFYLLVKNQLGGIREQSIDAFAYLRPKADEAGSAPAARLQSVDDEGMHAELQQALSDFAIMQHEKNAVFDVAAAVLRLGNVRFESLNTSAGVEGCSISGGDPSQAAQLLGVDLDTLRACLTSRTLQVGRDVTVVPLKPDQAAAARDGLAKLIYGGLFAWLVQRINGELGADAAVPAAAGAGADLRFIGVLDIAGFERFTVNSFEQLLINLSNEKLQQQFNQDIIKSELDDYKREGLSNASAANLDFADNAPILELIEGSKGLLDALDEELYVPKGSDQGFADKAGKTFAANKYFKASRFASGKGGGGGFSVVHFAGEVTYSVEGWLEKDRLAPPKTAVEMLQNATSGLCKKIAALLPAPDAKKKRTVSLEFRRELAVLMEKIRSTQVHYIRCIKPNARHAPRGIESHEIMRQLRCAGIMEAIKIRKSGYSMRITFVDFVSRYSIIAGGLGAPPTADSATKIIQAVLAKTMSLAQTDFVMGASKVFVRERLREALDAARAAAVEELRVGLQPFAAAYDIAVAQGVSFLYPQPLFADADSPGALRKKLQELETLLQTAEARLGSLDANHAPSWASAANLARGAMVTELEVTAAADAAAAKAQPLQVTPAVATEMRQILMKADQAGVHAASLETISHALLRVEQEADWETQLRSPDTDLEVLLRDVEADRSPRLTPSCEAAIKKVAQQVADARRKAAEKAEAERKAAADAAARAAAAAAQNDRAAAERAAAELAAAERAVAEREAAAAEADATAAAQAGAPAAAADAHAHALGLAKPPTREFGHRTMGDASVSSVGPIQLLQSRANSGDMANLSRLAVLARTVPKKPAGRRASVHVTSSADGRSLGPRAKAAPKPRGRREDA